MCPQENTHIRISDDDEVHDIVDVVVVLDSSPLASALVVDVVAVIVNRIYFVSRSRLTFKETAEDVCIISSCSWSISVDYSAGASSAATY